MPAEQSQFWKSSIDLQKMAYLTLCFRFRDGIFEVAQSKEAN